MTRSFRGTGFQPVDGGDPEQHQVRPRPRCLYVAQPPPAVIGRRPIPSPRWGRHSCLWWGRHSCLSRVRERGMYSSPRADSECLFCGAGFPTCTCTSKTHNRPTGKPSNGNNGPNRTDKIRIGPERFNVRRNGDHPRGKLRDAGRSPPAPSTSPHQSSTRPKNTPEDPEL